MQGSTNCGSPVARLGGGGGRERKWKEQDPVSAMQKTDWTVRRCTHCCSSVQRDLPCAYLSWVYLSCISLMCISLLCISLLGISLLVISLPVISLPGISLPSASLLLTSEKAVFCKNFTDKDLPLRKPNN